eukprot:jgi/Psemu1/193161/e_gw1.138.72.1
MSSLSLSFSFSLLVSFPSFGFLADAFFHNSCTGDVAKQFQFADCYLPDLADDLPLSEASFLMSHDAATGYLKRKSGLVTNGATNLYTKTQIGGVYKQLDDGARALDVRPKLLTNGTVVLHHGAVPIAISLETLVGDARRWALDNPTELVLILHSNFDYASASDDDDGNDDDNENDNDNGDEDDDAYAPSADTTVEVLSQVYAKMGVTYVECSDIYGLTVGEAKELAALSAPQNDDDGGDDDDDGGNNNDNGGDGNSLQGYLLAMDRHDVYAGSCAKQNWVEESLVTCYTGEDGLLPCTDRKSVLHRRLKNYALQSANNEPTDNSNELGPPASTYYYPLSEIQTIWQVDGISATLGVSHFSSIIDDNSKSHLNARVVDWIYDDAFDAISLLVVDNVRRNGNALTSVLRNRCGQSELSYDQFREHNEDGNGNGNGNRDENEYGNDYGYDIPCGTAVGKPHLRQGKPLTTLSFFATVLVCVVLGLWIAMFLAHYREHYDHAKEVETLERDLQVALDHCGCAEVCASDYASADSHTEAVADPDDSIRSHSTRGSDGGGGDSDSKRDPLMRLPQID